MVLVSRRPTYRPLAIARRVLLAALLLFVTAVVIFYFVGRLRRQGPGAAADGSAGIGARGDLVLSGEGFDYEVTEGDEKIFRVQAERVVSDRQDQVVLETVQIEIPRDDGTDVLIEGERGVYHLESGQARIEGDVRAHDAEGLVLTGEGFEVRKDGKVIVSTSEVSFGLGDEYRGRADELIYNFDIKRLRLAGEVRIESLDPERTTLSCDRLLYERQDKILRSEGSVELTRGVEYLKAFRLSVTLGDDQKRIRFIRASQGVVGRVRPEARGDELETLVDFEGGLLYVLMDEASGKAQELELEGRERRPALLRITDAGGLQRDLLAPRLRAELEGGHLRTAYAYEHVDVIERLMIVSEVPLRRVCAERAMAELDREGELQVLRMDGRVDFQEQGTQALGDRILLPGPGEPAVIRGEPALVISERGILQAPIISYVQETKRFEAEGGVRAELPRSRSLGLDSGEGREPVRVTSRTADWSDQPAKVRFLGEVRAWQGEDFLLAKELTAEPDEERLTAVGKVKTVLKPRPSSELEGEGEGAEGGPIEATADKLLYERAERLLSYSGNARVLQKGRVIRCKKLEVLLAEERESERFESLTCRGDLSLDDPEEGSRVTGSELVYVPATERADVTGNPVVLTKSDGTELRGSRLIYDFATGTTRLRSRQVEAAETGNAAEGPP